MTSHTTSRRLAALAALALASSAQATDFSADMVMTMRGAQAEKMKQYAAKTGQAMPTTVTMKIFVSGTRMRWETSMGPTPVVVITDVAANGKSYMIQPGRKTYAELPQDRNDSNQLAEYLKVGGDICKFKTKYTTCTMKGADVVGGRACRRYDVVKQDGKPEHLCVDEKLHFPILVEGEDNFGEVKNISEGAQPASLFQPPAGYTKGAPGL